MLHLPEPASKFHRYDVPRSLVYATTTLAAYIPRPEEPSAHADAEARDYVEYIRPIY